MGKIMDKLFGSIGDPVKAVAEVADRIVSIADGFHLSAEERLEFQKAVAEMQVKLNVVEASSPSLFKSGWRPFVGWICGIALAYNFVLRDLIAWALAFGHVEAMPPALDMGPLLTILLGMLGLGTLRTVEKRSGVAR